MIFLKNFLSCKTLSFVKKHLSTLIGMKTLGVVQAWFHECNFLHSDFFYLFNINFIYAFLSYVFPQLSWGPQKRT